MANEAGQTLAVAVVYGLLINNDVHLLNFFLFTASSPLPLESRKATGRQGITAWGNVQSTAEHLFSAQFHCCKCLAGLHKSLQSENLKKDLIIIFVLLTSSHILMLIDIKRVCLYFTKLPLRSNSKHPKGSEISCVKYSFKFTKKKISINTYDTWENQLRRESLL